MFDHFSDTLRPHLKNQRLGKVSLMLAGLVVLLFSGTEAEAQRLRLDAGGGWGFPTNNLELQAENLPSTPQTALSADLKAGPQVYAGIGLLRSIGEKFELGARVRAHTTRIQSTVNCAPTSCEAPEGSLRTATIEGRVIVTAPGWIHPYLLVGLGVVQASLDGVTVEGQNRSYSAVSVVDAGGDVGLGASIPIAGGLQLDAEVRATGSLPGGKENAVTVVPLTLGLGYAF